MSLPNASLHECRVWADLGSTSAEARIASVGQPATKAPVLPMLEQCPVCARWRLDRTMAAIILLCRKVVSKVAAGNSSLRHGLCFAWSSALGRSWAVSFETSSGA